MKKATIILKSNNIYNGHGTSTFSGVVVICDNKIQDVGEDSLVELYKGPKTKVIDLKNNLVIPGIHDAHIHFQFSALYASPYYCFDATSMSEEKVVENIAKQVAKTPKGQWVLGGGWYHPLWPNPALPSKKSLDEAYPNVPILLDSGDGHTAWVSSAGLEKLGITKETPNPPGGTIDRDENGELTGILREVSKMTAHMEAIQMPEDIMRDMFQKFSHYMNSFGITAMCDVSGNVISDGLRDDIYEQMLLDGKWTLRTHLYPTLDMSLKRPKELRDRLKYSMLQCTGVKQFLDGVSSTHTAYLKEDYSNAKFCGDRGTTTIDPEEMRKLVLKAIENDFSVRVHTIGDQAIHLMLNFYQEALEKYGKKPYLQHTLEHLENFQPDDISRVARLGVIPSVQPAHSAIDPNGEERDLGLERVNYMWPFRSLIDTGATLAFGTDSPVVSINPFENIYNAVTRQSAFTGKPNGGWVPSEKITSYEAVHSYTYGSACAANRSHELGTIAAGMLADIAVLDTNILTCDPEEIPATKAILTIVNGEIVYEAE